MAQLENKTIDATLADGESEEWVIETDEAAALKARVAGGAQPYDVDILTKPTQPRPGNFDIAEYASVLPDGVETFTDTAEHEVGSRGIDGSTVVQVTNNSGSTARFEGGIDLHSKESPGSALRFLTEDSGDTSEVFRDGEVSQRTIPEREPTGGGKAVGQSDLFRNPVGDSAVYVNLEPLGGTYKGTYTDLSATFVSFTSSFASVTGTDSYTSATLTPTWDASQNQFFDMGFWTAYISGTSPSFYYGATATADFRMAADAETYVSGVNTLTVWSEGTITPNNDFVINNSTNTTGSFSIQIEFRPKYPGSIFVNGSTFTPLPAPGGSAQLGGIVSAESGVGSAIRFVSGSVYSFYRTST